MTKFTLTAEQIAETRAALRRAHGELIYAGHEGTAARVHAVLALFPQPTPSAEPRTACATCDGTRYVTGPTGGGVPCPTCNAEPVSIADMAPGTRFVGDVRHGTQTFMVTIDSVIAAESGLNYFPEDIDPSTIRDVTPPPATPEAGK
jgi:hypothetical protein